MLSKTILTLATAALAAANPIRRDGPGCGGPKPTPTPTPTPTPNPGPEFGTQPTLPTNGGSKELPSPGDLSLKYILLGHGIQNYTCESSGATPKAVGALAALYDITPLYPGQSADSLTIEQFSQMGVDAIHQLDLPLNMAAEGVGADPEEPFPSDPQDLSLSGDAYPSTVPFVGHHFFNSNGVPQFTFNEVNYLSKLNENIDAPAGTADGPEGTGTVGWLQLGSIEGTTGGASLLYRVITVGGKSHGCSAEGGDSTSYTAQYWFFG